MGQASKIALLDHQIVEEVNRLCNDKHYVIDDIVKHLKGMGVETSKSAVGRYRKDVREIGQMMMANREAYEALKSQLGEMGDDETSRLNDQMLQGQLFNMQMRMMSGDYKSDDMVDDLRKLADMMYRQAAARKLDTDRVLKVREEVAKKALKEANAELKRAGQKGLSADGQARILKELGIKT